MKLIFDTLKYVKLLEERGLTSDIAEAMSEALSLIIIFNLYSRDEVNQMLSESVERVFEEEAKRRQSMEKMYDSRLSMVEQSFKDSESRLESRFTRLENSIDNRFRQTRNLIVTGGVAAISYLSALIHFTH